MIKAKPLSLDHPLLPRKYSPDVSTGLLQSHLASDLVRTDKFSVLIDDWAPEAAFEDHNGRQDESGTNLHQRNILADFVSCFLPFLVHFSYLIDSNPDLAIQTEDACDPIDKGLHPSDALLRNTKDASQKLSDEGLVLSTCTEFCIVKAFVKNHHTTPTFQTIASKSQLTHRMDVGDTKLGCGTVWALCKPKIKVLAVLAGFKEEDVVA